MPATIQTIETPKRWRAWDTSGNNNHGQIYSGRGLEFDGVSDYITLGADTTIVDFSAETTQANRTWTVACWLNIDNATNPVVRNIIGMDGAVSASYMGVYTDETLAIWDVGGAAWRKSNTALKPSTWYRCVFVFDGNTTISFYINGVADGTGEITNVDAQADLTIRYIGSRIGTNRFMEGKMSDLQAWNTAWTADDAAFDYANPEQLALNRGGTSLTESNLKLWYPMNDGHRGQQSYVLDASNTGLGDEMVTNGDFSDGTTGWTKSAVTTSTQEVIDGKLRMYTGGEADYPDGSSNEMSKKTLAISGKDKVMYRLTIDASDFSGGGSSGFIRLAGTYDSDHIISFVNGSNTVYFVAYQDFSYVKFFASTSSNYYTIDNFSLKPVNDKNHATTVFYGDELWDGADNSVTNWAASSGTASSEVASADCIKIIPGSSTTSSTIQLRDSKDLNTDLTIGRTYRVQADVATDVVSAGANSQFGVYDGTSYNYDSTPITTATNLVSNGDMETSSGTATGGGTAIANWNDYQDPTVREQSTAQKHNGSNSCKFTVNTDLEGIKSDTFSTVSGTNYLVSAWVYPDDTETVTVGFNQGTGTLLTAALTGLNENAWNKVELKFDNTQTGSNSRVSFLSPAGQTSGSWYIDDVVITAFQSKTLEFVADDEQDNYLANVQTHEDEFLKTDTANNQTFNADEGDWVQQNATQTWGAAFGATGSDGGMRIVGDGSSSLQGTKLQYGDWGSTIELGRRYIVQMDIKGAAGELDNFKFGFGNHYGSAFTVTTSFATYQAIFTPITTTNSLFVYRSGTTGETDPWYFDNVSVKALQNTWIDNISVKEVGTASGWTDADQQLDIPQTALQSYNQLAWFDGIADYVSIADHNDFSFGNGITDVAFSVSAWINMNDATNFPIVCKDTSSHREWSFLVNTSDKLRFYVYDNDASAFQGRDYNVALTSHEGKWIHVVATYNGVETNPSAGINLYINGEAVDNTDYNSGSYTAMHNKDGLVTIGARLEGSSYANGCITEVVIFDRNLTQAEVNELYNDGKALDALTHSRASDKMGYWRNNGLATWQDETDFNRDGTPQSLSETILQQAGVDASRDCQGFLMNSQKNTNALNLNMNHDDNGSTSYVKVKDSLSFDQVSGSKTYFSVSLWYKRQNLDDEGVLISKYDFGKNYREWGLELRADGTFEIQYGADSGAGYNRIHARVGGTDDTNWHHLGFIYNGNSTAPETPGAWAYDATGRFQMNGRIRIWIDGTEVADGADEWQWAASSTGDQAIPPAQLTEKDADICIGNILTSGKPYTSTNYWFDGQIDDVLYYSDVLTEDEIKRNYNAGKRSHR